MNDEQELLRHFRKLVDSQDRAYVIQRAAFMADLQAKEKRSRFELIAGTAIQEPVSRRAKAKARPKKSTLKIVADERSK